MPEAPPAPPAAPPKPDLAVSPPALLPPPAAAPEKGPALGTAAGPMPPPPPMIDSAVVPAGHLSEPKSEAPKSPVGPPPSAAAASVVPPPVGTSGASPVPPPTPSATIPPMPPTDPLVGSAPPPPATTTTVAPPPPPKEEAHPMPGEPPLAPTPGPVQTYQVRTPETLRDLARHTMGNSDRWADIYKLNPNLKPEATLAAGTLVRLPGDACVQPDDVEPVKPLPALRPKAPAKAKVVLPLTGTFPCNLDDKKAMTLPKAIRDQLGGSDTVLISPGPDRCLWLTNQAHLERLAQRLEQSPAREADVRIFKRLYFAQTEKTALTADGRVAVSERLAQFAGLHQEVVLIGIDDHFELWDAGRWRQYTQQKSAAAKAALADRE
jgi:MraZ protein